MTCKPPPCDATDPATRADMDREQRRLISAANAIRRALGYPPVGTRGDDRARDWNPRPGEKREASE